MAMYGTGSLALAVKAINVIAITVVSDFLWFSFLLAGAPTRTRIGAAEQSNASCSASGFAKQGRILLTGDLALIRFSIANCKQQERSARQTLPP